MNLNNDLPDFVTFKDDSFKEYIEEYGQMYYRPNACCSCDDPICPHKQPISPLFFLMAESFYNIDLNKFDMADEKYFIDDGIRNYPDNTSPSFDSHPVYYTVDRYIDVDNKIDVHRYYDFITSMKVVGKKPQVLKLVITGVETENLINASSEDILFPIITQICMNYSRIEIISSEPCRLKIRVGRLNIECHKAYQNQARKHIIFTYKDDYKLLVSNDIAFICENTTRMGPESIIAYDNKNGVRYYKNPISRT